jgi:hypothetical protein
MTAGFYLKGEKMKIQTDKKTVPDLTEMARQIETVICDFLNLDEKPAFAIAFTLPPEYNVAHWVTNVNRESGINLFEETAEKMKRGHYFPVGPGTLPGTH